MITSVLVANRGEIARRIFRTARDLGLSTVAVHSDVDTHQLDADAAVRLPGTSPAETYLRGDLIIAAALAAGADAIHPGYGFLSENAEFARAVLDAGLNWIGPPPSAMTAMASKVDARALVSALGIPILGEVNPESPTGSTEASFPLIIKASAGGGGRGMRIVRSPEELEAALPVAKAEAQNAFGDPTVFCEPYVEDAHHIEVQILADAHGTIWALGERDCSVQRRHQKVIEESPSPLVERTPGLRDKLFEAAVKAARAVGYVGAGTVEFLVSGEGFFFLEMNTRLQVEHPVTEAVTGLDLVALQFDVANGLPLPSEPPAPKGHAIEARLYAEDSSFTPHSGLLHRFEIAGPVRVDSGYASGDTVSTHYDAMLAKVISHAPTREAAAAKLAGALQRAVLHGPSTNRDLLVRVLRHPDFLNGKAHTAFLEQTVLEPLGDPHLAALAAALSRPMGFRNVTSQPMAHSYLFEGEPLTVSFRLRRGVLEGVEGVALVHASPSEATIDIGGVQRRFSVTTYGDTVYVDSATGSVTLTKVPRFTDPATTQAPGTLAAPMPGTVTEVLVATGDTVTAGQVLIRLEAMKMQHSVHAPVAGVVAHLEVHSGQQVDAGTPLIVLTEEEQP
jgi:propionyl-CoA carboxylase alpha chain